MESGKMVLMNLLAGQQWRHRHKEQAVKTLGKERVGQIERVTLKHKHDHV